MLVRVKVEKIALLLLREDFDCCVHQVVASGQGHLYLLFQVPLLDFDKLEQAGLLAIIKRERRIFARLHWALAS